MNRNLKKIIGIGISAFFVFSAVSCGTDPADKTGSDTSAVTESAKFDDAEIDYGTSKLYSEDELKEAVDVIKSQFSEWAGCEMHKLKYVGDECNTKKNIEWMNSIKKDGKYEKVAEFISEFHTPKKDAGTLDPDKEYTDYNWWLAKNKAGGWDLVTFGY